MDYHYSDIKETDSNVRPCVEYGQVKLLLASAARNLELYGIAETADFHSFLIDSYVSMSLLLYYIQNYFKEYHELPSMQATLSILNDNVNKNVLKLSESDSEELLDLCADIYNIKEEELYDASTFRYYLKSFIEDIIKKRVVGQHSEINVTSVTFAQELTRQVNILNGLQLTEDGTVDVPFSDGWDEGSLQTKIPTGVVSLDYFTEGGFLPCETYGLLGPTGSCKTITAVNTSVNLAAYHRQEWKRLHKTIPLRLVYYINYELTQQDTLFRALSYAAKISLNKLKNREHLYTSIDGPAESDLLFYKECIERHEYYLPERERKNNAIKLLNINWRALDFSGTCKDSMIRGCGYIPEIQKVITKDLADNTRARGFECACGGIVIDFVDAMIQYHLPYYKGGPEKARYDLTSAVGLNASNMLAKHFNCPVLLIQQLNGVANSLTPLAVAHHTEGVASKSFATNLDLCFCYGKPDLNDLCKVEINKTRRVGRKTYDIIKIYGEYCQLESVGHLYDGDTSKKEFQLKALPEPSKKELLEKARMSTTTYEDMNFEFYG